MHYRSVLKAIGLAILASVVAGHETPFNATFDDLVTIPVTGRLTPVGIYKNISFTNLDVHQPGAAGVTLNGVMPHSKPNQAVGFSSPSNPSGIKVGPSIKSFALSSFYYGCSLAAQQNAASTAVACNITVTGYAESTTPVATKVFIFAPVEPVSLQQAPDFGTFGTGFRGLSSATFVQEPSTLSVLLLDDITGSTVM